MFLFGTNLKMHQTPQATRDYVRAVRERMAHVPGIEQASLWIIPPFTSIEAAADEVRGAKPNIAIGAQNMHWADDGAFTGEISPAMLKACDASFVMLGHAERRMLFGETDEALNKKVLAAAQHGLGVMLCVGEPLHVKQANAGDAYVEMQLRLNLRGLQDPGGLRVLYEPLWSVGAGGTAADPADVARAFANIRRVLVSLFGAAGDAVPILYGGSVDATNCANYARLPSCAGMGVGRAGLRIDEFITVLTTALAAHSAAQHERTQ
jgi:triosephosphate isomerase